jgi:hypothetical protein
MYRSHRELFYLNSKQSLRQAKNQDPVRRQDLTFFIKACDDIMNGIWLLAFCPQHSPHIGGFAEKRVTVEFKA